MGSDDLTVLADEEIDREKARRQRRKRNEAFRRNLMKVSAVRAQHRFLMASICAAVLAWSFAALQVLR